MASKHSFSRALSSTAIQRQPYRRPVVRPSSCLYHHARQRLQDYRSNARTFSTSFAAQKQAEQMMQRESKRSTMRSPKLEQAAKMESSGDFPQDLGLIPSTFIYPRGANKPSWLHEPRDRARIEYHRVRSAFYDLFTSLHYKFQSTTKKPRPQLLFPLRNGKLAAVAEDLHGQMYTAFARGDAVALRELCTEGLLNSFRTRLSRRPARERLEWSARRVGAPRVVSHRAMFLPYKSPDGTTAALRQVVVRLRTEQSLKRLRTSDKASAKGQNLGSGEEEGVVISESEPRKVVEYLVLQRRLYNGLEEPWKLWGMTQETTVPRLNAMLDYKGEMQEAKHKAAMDSLNSRATASS